MENSSLSKQNRKERAYEKESFFTHDTDNPLSLPDSDIFPDSYGSKRPLGKYHFPG